MGIRHKARECALQILYQTEAQQKARAKSLISKEDQPEILSAIQMEEFFTHFDIHQQAHDFVCSLVEGTFTNINQIDEIIRSISMKWRLERMARVDKNILRLATYELMFCPDLPIQIIIDEAVEMARSFGSQQSAAFVNGILDNIASTVRQTAKSTTKPL